MQTPKDHCPLCWRLVNYLDAIKETYECSHIYCGYRKPVTAQPINVPTQKSIDAQYDQEEQ